MGFEGTKPTGNVGLKLNLHNKSEVTLQDCQAFNESLDNGSNAKWRYQFREVSPIIYFAFVDFTRASELQHGMFQPINQWLWRFSGDVREGYDAKWFRSKFAVDHVCSQGKDIAAYWLSKFEHIHMCAGETFFVSLPYPPLLMVDKNMSLDKAGQSKAVDIGVGRDWSVFPGQPWCRIEPASGTADNTRVNITADENTTGASRNAIITFKTRDIKGSATTDLFQSHY